MVHCGSRGFGHQVATDNLKVVKNAMQKNNITFKDVIEHYSGGEKYKELADKAPLHEVVLNMLVDHHPNPVKAQEYRIPRLWHGELNTSEGKSLLRSS